VKEGEVKKKRREKNYLGPGAGGIGRVGLERVISNGGRIGIYRGALGEEKRGERER